MKHNRGRQIVRWEDNINFFPGTKNFARISLEGIEWEVTGYFCSIWAENRHGNKN